MQELGIAELMREIGAVPRISHRDRVERALARLVRGGTEASPGCLLVLGEGGKSEELLGTVSIRDILGGVEKRIQFREEVPIFWQGQFLESAREILQDPVERIMRPIPCVISRSAPLMEALYLMNTNAMENIIVVEGETAVGLLALQDLFEFLARIGSA